MAMRKKKAFTLLELLIALALSSFVMMGLMQSYQALMRYMERSRDLIGMNRRVCLLFNQMERDFMTAFIPKVDADNKSDGKKGEKKEGDAESAEEKKDAKGKKKEFDKKLFFWGEADDNALFTKVLGKKLTPFKFVSFVNSNPLQIFGQKKIRYVRVAYELAKDKEHSKGEKVSYNLVRKETREIKNMKVKINEFDHEAQKNNPIRADIVAQGVKAFYIEYIGVEPPKSDGDKKGEELKSPFELPEKRLTSWGEKDFTQGVVPKRVEIYIDFWNEKMSASRVYHAVFPVMTFPTVEIKKSKQKVGNLGSEGLTSALLGQNNKGGTLPLPPIPNLGK